MDRTSSSQESEDEGLSVGTPTLSEIKDYFTNYQYYTAESSTSDSSGELSESFTELLEKRKQELSMKFPYERVQKAPQTPDRWMLGADESFLAAERMCEQTVEYNRYMSANAKPQGLREVLPDLEDETILNDVEPPSMLCEQTMVRNPANRPSTILEETTTAST